MAKLHVVKGDRVKVIAGKDRGTIGEVIAVDPQSERVTVSGVNIVKRHKRDLSQQTGRRSESGIISSEAPIHASNVQLVVKDDEGNEVTTRVGHRREETTRRTAGGAERTVTRSVRTARKTGKDI